MHQTQADLQQLRVQNERLQYLADSRQTEYEQAIRDKLAGLENARRARALSLTDPDPALLAGADLLWQTWIEQRRAALNGDLSRVLLAQETARAALGRAFGRDQVTEALNARARSDRVKTKARRDEGAS